MKNGLILVDVQPYMSAISLIEAGKLKEYYVEYKESENITGNIYKGEVQTVLTGLQSAFVNFGSVKNGFLSVEEAAAHKSVLEGAGVIPERIEAKEGDYVMVQATKEELGTKGARLTTSITLPGRYVILLPTLDFVGVSNKITDPQTREKLTKFLTKLKPAHGGYIARTACLEAKRSEIADEVKRLNELWKKIEQSYDELGEVGLVYRDGDLIFRTVRDMLSDNIQAIVCNDESTAKNLISAFKERNIKYYDRIEVYSGEYDIYDAFNVLGEVDKLLDRRVRLASGVTLVFDYTEALTVIDVNTAKFARGTNHEETVFQANLEAAHEIARQIRLRNIGGIIIVDFIDMTDNEHREQVLEALRKEVFFDRTKTRVLGMTGLGLVEITRKKVGREISTVLLDKCPFCKGDARAYSVDYVARKLKGKLKRLFADKHTKTAIVKLNGNLMESIIAGKYLSVDCNTIWRDKRIYLVPDPELLNRNFIINGSEDPAVTVPASAKLLY